MEINTMESITVSMVEKEISPEKIIDGEVIEAVKETKPVLSVTRIQETTETYTLEQIENTIVCIKKELANVQARLDYQYQLRDQLINK